VLAHKIKYFESSIFVLENLHTTDFQPPHTLVISLPLTALAYPDSNVRV